MAKIIRLTPDVLETVKKEFEKQLLSTKLSNGKFQFTSSFSGVKRDAVLYFTKNAWQKMQALVSGFNKEVAWHGIAKRGDDPEKDEYVISDILVYPQEVTGATVNTDQVEYQTWLMNHEDEVFNNIRMQGHSHVNMGTTPSGVDESLYDRILAQLEDDMFYIFMIWNKQGQKTIKIYDLAKNVLFETSDVTVTVMAEDDPEILSNELSDEEKKALREFLVGFREKKRDDAFIASAKEMVKDKVYSYTPAAPTQYAKNTQPPTSPSVPPLPSPPATQPSSGGQIKQIGECKKTEAKKTDKDKDFRFGRRKKTQKGKRSMIGFHDGMYDDYDDDDPYGWYSGRHYGM